eukprot:354329-Chlamydomonas_euryale.AAC.3
MRTATRTAVGALFALSLPAGVLTEVCLPDDIAGRHVMWGIATPPHTFHTWESRAACTVTTPLEAASHRLSRAGAADRSHLPRQQQLRRRCRRRHRRSTRRHREVPQRGRRWHALGLRGARPARPPAVPAAALCGCCAARWDCETAAPARAPAQARAVAAAARVPWQVRARRRPRLHQRPHCTAQLCRP